MEFKTDSKGTSQSLILLSLLHSLLILYFLCSQNYLRISDPFHPVDPKALRVMSKVFDKNILVTGEAKKRKRAVKSHPNSALIIATQGKSFAVFNFPYLTKPCVRCCPRDLRV